MKNKSLTRTTLGIFFLALVSLGVAVATTSFIRQASGDYSFLANRKALTTRAINPDDYTNVSTSELSCSITDYTGTSLSRYLKVQFQSKQIEAYKTTKEDVFYVIDDPNYSEDNNDPFIVPVADNSLNGFTYKAEPTAATTNKTIYISDAIKRGQRFKIKNTRIAEGCMTAETNWGDLETIFICSGVTTIDANAFTGVPDTVTIKCEVAEENKPAGWDANWTDAANILWGQQLDDTTQREVSQFSSTKKFGEAEDFVLGYKGNADIPAYPLTLAYTRILADGSTKNEEIELPVKHSSNPYDAVGSTIYSETNSFQISIDIEKGEELDENSFKLYNIFRGKKNYTNIKEAWPEAKMEEIYEMYSGAGFEEEFPVLQGNEFSYQLYETLTDKYITIHSELESDEKAQELVDQYIALLDEEVDEEGNKLYAIDDTYDQAKYGSVYMREVVTQNGEHFKMYVQLYVYESHFISFFIIDHLQQEEVEVVDAEGKETGETEIVYVLSRNLPIKEKAAAIRPYYWIPDIEGYGKLCSTGSKRFGQITFFSDIFEASYESASSFLGYTSVAMNVTKKLVKAYAGYELDDTGYPVDETKQLIFLKNEDGTYKRGKTTYLADEVKVTGSFDAPELYINNTTYRGKAEINVSSLLDGKFNFRYVLSDLNNAQLVVIYKHGGAEKTAYLPIKSPSPVIELSSNSQRISFMANGSDLDGVKPEDILYLGIAGMTVNMHLYNISAHAIVQNTNLLKVFGNLEVLPYTGAQLKFFNINLYLVIFIVALTAGYAVLAVALFFYLKNKYKNDEFRRMKPKQYIKTALGSYLGVLLIALGVNFIVLRFAVFNSSVPTFNPIDPFTMGFGIAMAISIGLFVRMFVIIGKANKKRKEAKRLNLDKDVADDGTK